MIYHLHVRSGVQTGVLRQHGQQPWNTAQQKQSLCMGLALLSRRFSGEMLVSKSKQSEKQPLQCSAI